MAENSSIEWCDHTFNPFFGCTKVSPGCDNCYAEHLMDKRMHKVVWGSKDRVRTSPANWRKPIAWNAAHAEFFAAHGRRQRVFCASLADVFDNAVDPAWRADLFEIIEQTPNLDWLLLTKRIGNVSPMMVEVALRLFWLDHLDEAWLPANVWLGATIVNQAEADRDIHKLLDTPAAVRFLSMEPLLGPVRLDRLVHGDESDLDALRGQIVFMAQHVAVQPLQLPARIDWVIVGGESGANARPIHPDWALSLRDQCRSAGVPLLFKQWGEWVPMMGHAEGVSVRGLKFIHSDGTIMGRAGKKAAGRMLNGRTHDEFPRGAA